MRICLLHRDLHARTRGGICTLYRALAPRLAATGHHVTLLTQTTPHPPTLPGVQVHTVPRTDDMAAHRAHITQALHTLRPDIVDASSWEAEPLDYLTHDHRAPVLIRGDLSAATMQARPHLITAERTLLHRADRVAAVSDFAADDLATAYRIARPPVLRNGVDRTWFRPGPAAPPSSGEQLTLAGDGTVIPTSRGRLAEQPAPVLWQPRRDRKRHLLWVGKPTPMKGWDQLEQLVVALADRAHITVLLGHAAAWSPVHLTGRGDVTLLHDLDDADVRSAYRAADALLSTSRWEGFGLAIAESLACTTPALVPTELGTATELLAGGGGARYGTTAELCSLIDRLDYLPGGLSSTCDWDANTTATLAHYRSLLNTAETSCAC